MRKINIGLTEVQRRGVIKLLNIALANAYLLVIKTRKYHWDVVGPQFMTLHELWQKQYETLAESVDDYAERIRQLGDYPVGTMQGFLSCATIIEHPGDLPNATIMVERLVNDHEAIICHLRGAIDQCSDEYHDEGTADFLTGQMEMHEEMAWMLRAFIEGEHVTSRPHSIHINRTRTTGFV